MKKWAGVETFWIHDVSMSARLFLALERESFASLMSLVHSFCVLQFFYLLFGLFPVDHIKGNLMTAFNENDA
ncbi:MAG: hypothetical protein JSW66_14040 [Phycisphaerales bacterium]|nr:MAG: hypothetical protein JSW66_14040 [Phycisphaerales bacterium]